MNNKISKKYCTYELLPITNHMPVIHLSNQSQRRANEY